MQLIVICYVPAVQVGFVHSVLHIQVMILQTKYVSAKLDIMIVVVDTVIVVLTLVIAARVPHVQSVIVLFSYSLMVLVHVLPDITITLMFVQVVFQIVITVKIIQNV